MADFSESNVRAWLKKQFGSDIKWTEAANGGTTGIPDASLTLFGETVEVELKFWKWNVYKTKHPLLRMSVRPAQRRYHIISKRDGKKTIIIAGIQKHPDIFTFENSEIGKKLVYSGINGEPSKFIDIMFDPLIFIKGYQGRFDWDKNKFMIVAIKGENVPMTDLPIKMPAMTLIKTKEELENWFEEGYLK